MAKEAPLYDLVLLLSPDAEETVRTKILRDVESAITGAGGSVERNDDWGRRPMAYEIRHQPEAEYHLLQFHAPGTLIEELSHTLRITDGVARFRVIKVRPGTPEAPSSVPVVAAVASGHSGPGAPGAGNSGASPAPAGDSGTSSAEAGDSGTSAEADESGTSAEADAES